MSPVSRSQNRSVTAATCGLTRSEEHTSELQSQSNLVCRLLLEKTKGQAGDFRTSGRDAPDRPGHQAPIGRRGGGALCFAPPTPHNYALNLLSAGPSASRAVHLV